MTEAVIKSGEISNNQKNQIIELLGALSSEAVVPKGKRKSAVIKALISELAGILSGFSVVVEIWDKVKNIIG